MRSVLGADGEKAYARMQAVKATLVRQAYLDYLRVYGESCGNGVRVGDVVIKDEDVFRSVVGEECDSAGES